MRTFDFSKFNKRIKLKQAEHKEDDFGGYEERNWVFYCELWGDITPLKFEEKQNLGRLEQKLTHTIITRYFHVPPRKTRVEYKERIFNIKHIINYKPELWIKRSWQNMTR